MSATGGSQARCDTSGRALSVEPLDQAKSSRRSVARFHGGQIHDELGEVSRKNVLGYQHGVPVASEGDPLHHEHRALWGDPEEASIIRTGEGRTDGLRRSTEIDRKKLLKARPLDIHLGQLGTKVLTTPHRHPGEGSAVGQTHSPNLEDTAPQNRPHVRRRIDELEVDHTALGRATRACQLGLDRVEGVQGLTYRIRGHEPTETLAGIDQALGTQQLERLADGHPTGVVGRAEGRLRGKNFAWPELTVRDASSNFFGDLLIANRPHLYYGCIKVW